MPWTADSSSPAGASDARARDEQSEEREAATEFADHSEDECKDGASATKHVRPSDVPTGSQQGEHREQGEQPVAESIATIATTMQADLPREVHQVDGQRFTMEGLVPASGLEANAHNESLTVR